MPTALVLGVNGQDGSYLAETLIARGYHVTGVGRQANSRYVFAGPEFTYVELDLTDREALSRLLVSLRPDLAFHVAAIHGSAGSTYESVFADMTAVNVLALHVLLEHARCAQRDMRIIYANSLKIFPTPYAGVIDEATPYRASCLYSISKISSLELIAYYRRHHAITGSNLILFNHDSARRGSAFFVPTIARALTAAIADPKARTQVKTLDFWIDWTAADEVMDVALDVAEKAPGQDYVIASGMTWHGREAVSEIFSRRGLDYRNHIEEVLPRSDPGPRYSASIERLAGAIGRRPVKTIFDIVDSILASSSPAGPSEMQVASCTRSQRISRTG